MVEIMDRLEEEHDNMAKLLDILEHQLASFAEAGDVDYDLILDIIDYFLDYPDLVHHPKEDLIYQRLRKLDPGLASQVGDLEAEHREVGALTREFGEAVHAVLLEADISRDDVLAAAKAFIDYQRQHMELERTTFFPAALEALNENHWKTIDNAARKSPDPLFGGEVERRYEALRESIMRMED